MKKWFTRLFVLLGVGGLGVAGWVGASRYRAAGGSDLPVATARSGEFVAIIRCRGDLKADRSYQIYAPFTPNLRIAFIAPAGEPVKQGDPIVRFDSSTAKQDLIQKEAALRQAQASYDQAVTQARITAEHDQADLVDAEYQVELARLKTAGNEFIGRIQAEQNKIDFELAQQKLRLQEATIGQHKAADEAKLASLQRSLDAAKFDLELTQGRQNRMELTAPASGYWIISPNYSQGTANSAPFKAGDNVFAGMVLGVIPDMSSLVIDVKVEETDRGRIAVGNDVKVRVDAVPELAIDATLTQISPLAEMSLEGQVGRSFRAYAALPNPDPRIRPGMNGGMDIVIERIPDAISVPAKAIFTLGGKPVVYAAQAGGYRAVEVQVLARNPDEVAVSGLGAGSQVALVEPPKDGGSTQETTKQGATE